MNRLNGFVVMGVVFLEPFLVAIWIAVGSGRQRRSHFWVRAFLAALGLPALMAGIAGLSRVPVPSPLEAVAGTLLMLLFCAGVIALMFVPGLLYLPEDSSPGPSDSDGGGGQGPGRPRRTPGGPGGGIPLPDADQARARVRDHDAPKLHDVKPRRRAHEPRRTPAAPLSD